jgi:hypothetical protein
MAHKRMREYCANKDRAGVRHGRVPFGTKREGSGYDARFVPNDDAPAVVRCLNLYASGLTYDSAAARLNAEGVPFRGRDGRPKRWGRESVRTVVGNVLHYVGYHVPNTGWDAKTDRIKLAGPEMGDYVDRWAAVLGARPSSAITPVIDRELANAVIERRYRNQHVGKPAKGRPFLLTPIVFWNGHRLHGRTRHYGRFYATHSERVMLDADHAEAFVLSKLAGLQFPPEMIQQVREMLMARMDASRLAALQARIEDAKRKLSTLADLYLDNRISRADYERKFAEFSAELRAAEAELAQPVEVERAMRMLGDLGGMLGQMTPEAQKRNLHRIFTRIELNDDGEAVRVEVKPWVRRAFEPILTSPPELTTNIMPKVGVNHNLWTRCSGGQQRCSAGLPASQAGQIPRIGFMVTDEVPRDLVTQQFANCAITGINANRVDSPIRPDPLETQSRQVGVLAPAAIGTLGAFAHFGGKARYMRRKLGVIRERYRFTLPVPCPAPQSLRRCNRPRASARFHRTSAAPAMHRSALLSAPACPHAELQLRPTARPLFLPYRSTSHQRRLLRA